MYRPPALLFILLFTCFAACVDSNKHTNAETVNRINSLLQAGKKAEENNYDQADSFYQEALSLSKELQNDSGIFKAYRYLIYNNGLLKGNFEDGFHWGQLAVAYAQDHPAFKANAYSSMAMLYHAHQKTDSAAAYYQQAILLAENNNDTTQLAPLYSNISGLYNMLGNNQLAKEYMSKYISFTGNDTTELIGAYSNMSIYCSAMNDFAGAAQYLSKAYNMLQRYPGSNAAPQLYSNLADQAFRQGRYDSTRYFASLRLQSANALSDTLSMIKGHLMLVNAFLAPGNTPDATSQLDTVHLLTNLFSPPVYVARDIARADYMLYKAEGTTGKAFTALEQFTALDSTIAVAEQTKELQNFERSREAAKAEKSILTKQLQVNRRNTAILLLIATLAVLLAVIAGIILRSRKQRVLNEKRIQYLAAEAEWNQTKASLEAQLEERNRISRELHDDLGASLTTIALAGKLIQSKAPESLNQEITIITGAASGMVQTLNEIVWSLNSRNDSLFGLLAYIRKFAAGFLEKTGIHFTMNELSPGLEDVPVHSAMRRSLYLACKEAIHNCVKHSGATHVQMNAAVDAGVLHIAIKDNGKGMVPTGNPLGNGLLNIKKAMETLGGQCIVTDNAGTIIEMVCPLAAAATAV